MTAKKMASMSTKIVSNHDTPLRREPFEYIFWSAFSASINGIQLFLAERYIEIFATIYYKSSGHTFSCNYYVGYCKIATFKKALWLVKPSSL